MFPGRPCCSLLTFGGDGGDFWRGRLGAWHHVFTWCGCRGEVSWFAFGRDYVSLFVGGSWDRKCGVECDHLRLRKRILLLPHERERVI